MKVLTKLKNRLSSWATWLALVSLIVYIVKLVTGTDIGGAADELCNVLLPVLVGFGIVNNPDNRGEF